jgi:aspartyl-tRNA synthetase
MVRTRPQGQENKQLATGRIEVVVRALQILSTSDVLPFPLDDEHHHVSETVCLKNRMLDLRRPHVQEPLIRRAHIVRVMRRFLDERGFLDIETPMLTRATPEGSRDYLVPSRIQHGHFYALPQSPQLFKQLYMMAGFDRYYQVTRCFRDEDLRADRQPEFTQLDLEASFVNEKDIQDLIEELMKNIFKEVMKIDIQTPFLRCTYDEVMRDYASDKPDLRIPLKLVDIHDCVQDVDFAVFAKPARDPGSRVVALKCPNGCETLTRKMLDDYGTFVGQLGAKGLAYIKVNDRSQGLEGCQSPILKFLNASVVEAILNRVDAKTLARTKRKL